jgi:Ankyrin repeats (3 copies)/Inhibitor of vertebrate lysozyme (Ivy)
MKIGAGIAGILLGIICLLYVGVFGGLIGAGAGWLGSIGPGNSTITSWASGVSLLSWLAPLVTIIGGIVTFSNPRAGGVILGASAFLLWYLLGLGMIGTLFVIPIAATAVLALITARSGENVLPLAKTIPTPAAPGQSESSHKVANFDRAKWNALLQYDKNIAMAADQIRPLGQAWLDEFAAAFLALNDKQYIPEILERIRTRAQAENARHAAERAKLAEWAETERQALAHEAQERKERRELWRRRLWGTTLMKVGTLAAATLILLLVALVIGSVIAHKAAEERKMARTALLSDAVRRDDWEQVRQLVQEGVDPNATIVERDGSRSVFLIKAIFKSNTGDQASLDVVRWLVEHGANVNPTQGATPLGIARNTAVLSLLLSHGATVDLRYSNGETALHTAACMSSDKIDFLIANHADINLQSNSGYTPLHEAVACLNLPSVKALIDHGADVNMKTSTGKTPLDLCLRRPDICGYLKVHGATGDIPIKLPSLDERRRDPAYNAVFLSLFNGRTGVPSWLSGTGYVGNGMVGRVVTIGDTKYELFVICKPHNCGGNFLHVLFTNGGGTAWALTTENGNNFRFFGSPNQELQAFLTGESIRNGRGEWP